MGKYNMQELLSRYEAGEDHLYDEVTRLVDEALSEDPDNPELLHSRGYIDECRGRRLLKKAASYYEKGVQIVAKSDDPKYSNYVKCDGQLIGVRSALGQTSKSIDLYKQRISDKPEDLNGYCLLTTAYYLADQVAEAQKVIEAAYKIDQNHAMVNYWMGEVYSRLGQVEQALRYWGKTMELDPSLIDARFSRAFLLERLEKLEEAAQEWTLIVEYLKKNHLPVDAEWPEQELARIQRLIQESNN